MPWFRGSSQVSAKCGIDQSILWTYCVYGHKYGHWNEFVGESGYWNFSVLRLNTVRLSIDEFIVFILWWEERTEISRWWRHDYWLSVQWNFNPYEIGERWIPIDRYLHCTVRNNMPNMKMAVLWDVASCILVETYQRFICACCLLHEDDDYSCGSLRVRVSCSEKHFVEYFYFITYYCKFQAEQDLALLFDVRPL